MRLFRHGLIGMLIMLANGLLSCSGDGLKAVKDAKTPQETAGNEARGREDESGPRYSNCQEATADLEKAVNELKEVSEAAHGGDTEAQIKYLEMAARIEKIGFAIQEMSMPLSPACKEKLMRIQEELGHALKKQQAETSKQSFNSN